MQTGVLGYLIKKSTLSFFVFSHVVGGWVGKSGLVDLPLHDH